MVSLKGLLNYFPFLRTNTSTTMFKYEEWKIQHLKQNTNSFFPRLGKFVISATIAAEIFLRRRDINIFSDAKWFSWWRYDNFYCQVNIQPSGGFYNCQNKSVSFSPDSWNQGLKYSAYWRTREQWINLFHNSEKGWAKRHVSFLAGNPCEIKSYIFQTVEPISV